MIDLFPTTRKILSVSELTRSIRTCLEAGIGEVWVEGEISNHRRQGSGHQYFTLKDDRSQVACVLFRATAQASGDLALEDGMCVQVFGEVTAYEARGQCQLVVGIIQQRGVGALQARFEALKRRLQAEGLFAEERKKTLPRFPLAVGVVTSPTGAALQDMLNVLRRRAPWLRVLIHPVRVQGAGASLEIAAAIRDFNRWAGSAEGVPAAAARVDLIVLARGGGSIEDLFEFNEEIVARAIFDSSLPVVSAVGHEIDFTISDFVADLRAPTPSAAAELIAPDLAELRRQLGAMLQLLGRRLAARLGQACERLQALTRGGLHREARRRALEERQRLDLLDEALGRSAAAILSRARGRLDEAGFRLRSLGPQRALELRRQSLTRCRERLDGLLHRRRDAIASRLRQAANVLRVLGPQATLARGYSITTKADGAVVSSGRQLAEGEVILTRLHDGAAVSIVTGLRAAGEIGE